MVNWENLKIGQNFAIIIIESERRKKIERTYLNLTYKMLGEEKATRYI